MKRKLLLGTSSPDLTKYRHVGFDTEPFLSATGCYPKSICDLVFSCCSSVCPDGSQEGLCSDCATGAVESISTWSTARSRQNRNSTFPRPQLVHGSCGVINTGDLSESTLIGTGVHCHSVVVLNGNAGSSPAIIHAASLRGVFLSVRSSSIASGN